MNTQLLVNLMSLRDAAGERQEQQQDPRARCLKEERREAQRNISAKTSKWNNRTEKRQVKREAKREAHVSKEEPELLVKHVGACHAENTGVKEETLTS